MASTKKDATILVSDILGRQTCSECHKYLSVGPVMVTRSGRTVCGRCNIKSFYDKIAEKCIFPCVNHNSGCKKLLPYNEVKHHETKCSKKAVISCTFCSYEGDERQFIQHFKEVHSEYVVDKVFELNPEDGCSRNLIFLRDEHILCVTIIISGGRAICGRCNIASLYDQVAGNCLFPCINHNAGCKELLSYNEAKDHEASCDKNNISCPFCYTADREDHLAQHFKEEHSEYVVDNIFEITLEDGFSRNLIFLKDRPILCMSIIIGNKFVKFYNTLLAPSTSNLTHFTLSFFKLDNGAHFVTPQVQITHNSRDFPVAKGASCVEQGDDPYIQLENCFLLAKDFLADYFRSNSYFCKMDYVSDKNQGSDVSKLGQHKEYEKAKLLKTRSGINSIQQLDYILKMSAASLRQFLKEEFREMQKCSSCKVYVIAKKDIFFCPNNHLACRACIYKKCLRCKSFVLWNNHSEWHNVYLKCEWACKSEISIFDYLRHVQLCNARQYRCPDRNCKYVGCLEDLKNHWHLPPLNCNTMLRLSWSETAFHWLIMDLNELVYVTKEWTSSNDLLVTVYEDAAVWPKSYVLCVNMCSVVQNWVPLKNLGRAIRLRRLQGGTPFELSAEEVTDPS